MWSLNNCVCIRYSLKNTNLLRLELSKAKPKFKMLTNTSEALVGPPFQKEDPTLFLDPPFPLQQEFVFLVDLAHGLVTATPKLPPLGY